MDLTPDAIKQICSEDGCNEPVTLLVSTHLQFEQFGQRRLNTVTQTTVTGSSPTANLEQNPFTVGEFTLFGSNPAFWIVASFCWNCDATDSQAGSHPCVTSSLLIHICAISVRCYSVHRLKVDEQGTNPMS